jgi:putative MFS transporter
MEMATTFSTTSTHSPVVASGSAEILARMERLPLSSWHLKARAIVGSATFFDGIDYVAIGMVLPVIGELWHLTPGEIGWLISGGFLGQMIGAIGFGRLAERIGRIPTAMLTTAVFALGGILSAFAWSFATMLVIRFLQGLGLGAEVPVAATYINEIAPADKRGRFVLLYELVFAVGLVAAGFLGRYAIPAWGWQSIFLIGSVPPLFVLLLLRSLPESPRWLLGAGRTKEADQVVTDIERQIKASGKVLPPPIVAPPAVVGTGTWQELFSPTYRTRTFVIWTIWLTIGFISWPLTIWLPSIYRTVFHVPIEAALTYSMYNNITLFLGAVAVILLIDRVGRRRWFAGALAGAGIALAALGLLGAGTVTMVLTLSLVTLFCISSLNLAIYLYTPELYPTRLRAAGCGVALAWARIGSIVAPPMIGWGMASGGLGVIFLALGVIALAACTITALYATETTKRILEEVSP